MNDKVYDSLLRFDELAERHNRGDIKALSIHPDPNHGLPEGPHLDVKILLPGATRPECFKVLDVGLARAMDGDINLGSLDAIVSPPPAPLSAFRPEPLPTMRTVHR